MKKFFKEDILVIFFGLFIVFTALTITSRGFDTYVFFHKDWKKWEKIVDNADNMRLLSLHYYGEDDWLNNYKFMSELDGEDVWVIYWTEQGTVSVHDTKGGDLHWLRDDCILSEFDKYHSKKMVKIIDRKLAEGSFVKDKNYYEFVKK